MNTLLFLICLFIQDDWSQWGGSERDFRVSAEVKEISRLLEGKPTWSVDCQATNAGIVVQDEMVFLFERLDKNTERICCRSLIDGAQLWTHVYQAELPEFFDLEFGYGPHSTPAISQDRVICIGSSAVITCLACDTGEVVWKRDLWTDFPNASRLERGFAASPLMVDQSVVVSLGGKGCGVLSLDAKTGETLWQSGNEESAYTSPVLCEIEGKRMLVILLETQLVGLDPRSGERLWTHPYETSNSVHVASPKQIAADQLIVGSSDRTEAIQLKRSPSGWQVKRTWSSPRLTPQVGNFLSYQQQIIGPSNGGAGKTTTILSSVDGKQIVKRRMGGRGVYVKLNDGVLMLHSDGDLQLCQWNGKSLDEAVLLRGFVAAPAWSHPAISKHYFVVRNGNRLAAFLQPLSETGRD